jgi:NodT family efflux transporter outer membrane factor (OMF) lipoprotein
VATSARIGAMASHRHAGRRVLSLSFAKLLPIIAVIAQAAGCTVGPDFTSPREPQTKSYVGDGPLELPSPGEGDVTQQFLLGGKVSGGWWTLFRSPKLDGIIEQALASNRTLAAAQARLAQAREAIAQVAGAYYPQVTFGASASRQKTNLAAEGFNTAPTIFNLYSVGPNVSFVLDPFGVNRRRVEEQVALADAQEYELDAAFLTLTGNAALAGVNIAASRAQVKAVEDIIADDERNLALVARESRAGELTKIDIESASSQLASDRTLLPPLRQQLNVAASALAVLVAKAPADWTPPELDLADLSLPEELPLTLPSELVHQRPDVLLFEARLHAASADIGIATAQLYPNITLSAAVGQEALTPGHLFLPMSNIWSLAGTLAAPIFEGGALEAQRRGAERGFDVALANYEQTVLQSFSQIADVLHALAHDAELVREERRALAAAESSLRLTRATFSFGNVSLLQVLDAQRQYEQARLGLIGAQAQRYRDTIQLFVAMGSGWREWREATTHHGSAMTPANATILRTSAR